MNIAVLIKLALDTSQLRISGGRLIIEDTPMKISDIDRNAVEEAVKIKQKLNAKAVGIAVLKWPPIDKRIREGENILREPLAAGLDEAYLVVDEALIGADASTTAVAIAEVLKKVDARLVIAGEASIDGFTSQVPPRVASILNWPVITYVRELNVEDGKVVAKRDLETEVQTVECEMPVVVSVTREINIPRIPTLLQIRAAMKKPIHRISLRDLGISVKPAVKAVDLTPLEVKRKNILIKEGAVEEKVEALLKFLVEEGVLAGVRV